MSPALCAAALALLLAPLPVWAADDAVRYVNASRLPLRVEPSAGAEIAGHAIANEEIRLVATKGEWCEVTAGTPAVHGYCQCKYLAGKLFTLATIDDQLAHAKLTPRERQDWLSRAFWVAPSLTRWIAVGGAMEEVLLSQETREKESAAGKPMRFKVPEFEAMKKRLEQGVVAQPAKKPVFTEAGYNVAQASARKRIALPKIKPSLFGEGEVFALPGQPFNLESSTAGAALVDSLSAFHKVSYRVNMEQPAFYLSGNAETMVAAWDVGSITARFDAPLRINGITRYGHPTALDIEAVGMDFNLGGCYGSSLVLKTRAVKKMPPWQDTLVTWVGKPASAKAAKVKTRRIDGKGPYDKLVVDDIDVDGDGVADFSVWNGRYQPQVSADGLWQAVFVNVAGQWQLLAYQEDLDCT